MLAEFALERFGGEFGPSPEEFEQRILGAAADRRGGGGFGGLQTFRFHQNLGESTVVAGKSVNEFFHLLALLFGGLGEFNSHAEIGMHHQHHAFRAPLLAGNWHREDEAGT